jgi:HEAT repeat protein
MNQLLHFLTGGDLRSDGMATEVAKLVLENDDLFDELLEGLMSSNPVIRGRTSDSIEKIARQNPDLIVNHLPDLINIAKSDDVMMVRMHLAMILGHILVCIVDSDEIFSTLKILLCDNSVFTRSWAIVSLCIMARIFPHFQKEIIEKIAPLKSDNSVAIRTKAVKAINVLLDVDAPFPKGWIKSIHLQDL